MNLSEKIGGKHEPETNGSADAKTDFMNLRKPQRTDILEEKIVSARASHDAVNSLIRSLVDLLPKPEGIWPLEDRVKWLRLAAGIFDLGYKAGDGERREIDVAAVELDQKRPRNLV
jgi:hypothetical protein